MAEEGSITARTVYVENACSLSEIHLKSALKKFGEVAQCRAYQSHTFVQFCSQKSAEAAIAHGSVDAYGIHLILRRYESHLDPAAGSNRLPSNGSVNDDRRPTRRGGQSRADDRRPPRRGRADDRRPPRRGGQSRVGEDQSGSPPPTRGDYGRGRRGRGGRGRRGGHRGYRGRGGQNNLQVESDHQGYDDDDDDMVETVELADRGVSSYPSSVLAPMATPPVPRPLPDQVSRPLSNSETMLSTTMLQPILMSKIPCHSVSEDDVKVLLRSAIIKGTCHVLRYTLLEDQVLVSMDIKQTAMERKDMIFGLLQQGRCTPKISDAFCNSCIKGLKDSLASKSWMVEKCEWSEGEKKERVMRSEMIEHLEAFNSECVPLQSFLNRCSCAVSEENINRVCSGVMEVLPDKTVAFCKPARRLAWELSDSCMDHVPTLPRKVATNPSTNVQATIPSANVQATIPSANVQATIPSANVQATIPLTNVPATIPSANVQATIPSANVQATIPSANVQATIPSANVQATIPLTNVQATIPSANVQATIPSANVQATIPSANVQATNPSTNVQATIPSANVQATIPSANLQATISSANVQATISSANVQATIPSANVQATIPSANVQATIPTKPTIPSTNVQATIPTKPTIPSANVQATIPSTNVQATIPPKSTIPSANVQATSANVQATIPSANVQATIPSTNVQATIPSANVQATIPSTNVQATIPSTNIQATIPPKSTIPSVIPPAGMQAFVPSAGMNAAVLKAEDQRANGANATPIIHQSFFTPTYQPHQYSQPVLPSRQSTNRSHGGKIVTPRYHERTKAPLVLADIQVPLTRATYKDKFNKLLFWEESEHMVILRDRCNGCYHLTLDRARHGYITSISGDTIAYAIQASEGATVIIEQGAKVAGGKILIQEDVRFHVELLFQNYTDTEEQLSVELPEESIAILQAYGISCDQVSFRVRVEFELKHSYFDGLHKNIDQLSPEIIARVLPTTFPPFEKCLLPVMLDPFLELCSQDQRDALLSILSLPHNGPPLLVRGAFGTGKTFLLAAAIHCLLHRGGVVRVLVCTQQHTSALAFLECFHNRFSLANSAGRDSVCIFRLVPETKRDSGHNDYCTRVVSASQMRPERERIQSFSWLLIVTTCGTSKQLCNIFSDDFFTHILVDEGAQLREPEAMAPLLLAGPQTRIVISGDEYQVGPNLLVLGDDARGCGLKFSLLERLHHLYDQFKMAATSYEAALTTNHRSHPHILTLVNTLFYKCNLSSAASPGCAHPLAPFPLVFVCSRADDTAPRVESSVDEGEANLLLEHARTYANSWPESVWGKIDYSQLCIVSVGRSQLTMVAKVLKNRHFPSAMHSIQRQPTFDIQGRQFRAVFVSTAEPTEVLPDGSINPSNPTKSICDPFVFNTVMTRAQSLVVCVGNPFLLLRLEQSMVKKYGDRGRCWSHYLKACLDHNTVLCGAGAVRDDPSVLQRIAETIKK